MTLHSHWFRGPTRVLTFFVPSALTVKKAENPLLSRQVSRASQKETGTCLSRMSVASVGLARHTSNIAKCEIEWALRPAAKKGRGNG